MLFSSWTALCLAIDNEWGGPSSRQKAEQLYQDVLHWFYNHTEHYADDLEVDLEAAMMQDFNAELQDDSPRQVSITLVSLHQECLQGNLSRIQQLKEHISTNIHNLAQSQQEVVDRDGTVLLGGGDDPSSSDDDEQGVACMQGADQAMEEDAPDAVPFTAQNQGLPLTMQRSPVIDQDGFQTVQTRRRAVQTH
ncbi:hypothetical protein WJX77_010678 [Trebouxia sp. C0004]